MTHVKRAKNRIHPVFLTYCSSASHVTNTKRVTDGRCNTKTYVINIIRHLHVEAGEMCCDTCDAADADSFTPHPQRHNSRAVNLPADLQETFCTERDQSTAPPWQSQPATATGHHLPLARRRADLHPWRQRYPSYHQLKLSACVLAGGHRCLHRRPFEGSKSCWSISACDQLQATVLKLPDTTFSKNRTMS